MNTRGTEFISAPSLSGEYYPTQHYIKHCFISVCVGTSKCMAVLY